MRHQQDNPFSWPAEYCLLSKKAAEEEEAVVVAGNCAEGREMQRR